jgi:hypothetical protein
VPDTHGEIEAKKFGFPAKCIDRWDTESRAGVEGVGRIIRTASEGYMQARSQGIRGTKSIFDLDLSNLTSHNVEAELQLVPATKYAIWPVYQDTRADDFVNSLHKAGRWHEEFRLRSVFYELSKPEEIQPQKDVMIQRNRDGKVFGGDGARRILNLPQQHVKVGPGHSSEFTIFVQSTAPNRKLIKGTNVLVLK